MSYQATADLSPLFFARLSVIADELDAEPLDLLGVMYSESGCKAEARNPNGNASGLIQFMPKTLEGLGWTSGDAAFRQLTAEQQLPYVRRYFAPHKGRLHDLGAVYVAVFLPALLDRATSPDYVLCARGGPLGWAYENNAGLDKNGDYRITRGELVEAVRRNCRGKRWEEIQGRATGRTPRAEPPPAPFDVRTVRGLQEALRRLGFDPGAIDGYGGPQTRGAVAAFQKARGLVPDGIAGPFTRGALRAALASTP